MRQVYDAERDMDDYGTRKVTCFTDLGIFVVVAANYHCSLLTFTGRASAMHVIHFLKCTKLALSLDSQRTTGR